MIFTLTGENTLQLRQELKARVQNFVQEHGDFGLERLNAEEAGYARIAESVQAMPFLALKRMVILESPSSNKELSEKIDVLLDSVNEETDLLIVEPKFDKRSVLYKTLKKRTQFQEFPELDERALGSWLVSQAKAQGGTLSVSDASALVQRVGTNQLQLQHELSKLLDYQPAITGQTIELLTQLSPQSSVFNLLDAAFAGNYPRALQIYREQRQLKVEPHAILALVAWQLHIVAVVKAAAGQSADAIASQAKINPFAVRKTLPIAQRMSLQDIKTLLHNTLDLDIRLKSESLDADAAMQNYLLTIS